MSIQHFLSAAALYYQQLRQLQKQSTFPILQEGLVFNCPLNWRKRHNLAVQQISKPYLAKFDLALPHIVHVGVTTICNLRCPACPTGTKALGRPGQHLDFQVYRRMVDELRSSLLLMLFWDWGESLLHPRITDMIAYAKRSHIKTVLSTNASMPFDDQRLERLVASGLDVLIVCVDGLTQATHEKYRTGSKLSTVLDFGRRLVQTRQRLGVRYPVLEFRTLATQYNEPELPALLRLAEDIGADFFTLKSLRPFDYRGHDVDKEMVPLNPSLARYAYEATTITEASRRQEQGGPLRCGKPMFAPTLNSNGELAFCSYAHFADEIFGNLALGGFKKLWRSAQARHKRLAFLQQEGTRSCGQCYFRSDHKPCILYTVPFRPLPAGITVARPVSTEAFLHAVEGANTKRPAA